MPSTLQVHLLPLRTHIPRRLILLSLGPDPAAALGLLPFLGWAVHRQREEVEGFGEVGDEAFVGEEVEKDDDVGEEDEEEDWVEDALVG